jgi:hypothetical protein
MPRAMSPAPIAAFVGFEAMALNTTNAAARTNKAGATG